MKKLALIFLINFWNYSIWSQYTQHVCYYQDGEKPFREHLVDFEHLELHLSFDTLQSKVIGKATHSFTSLRDGLDSIVLDAVNINIQKILFQNQPISTYKQQDNLLTIRFPKQWKRGEKGQMVIEYSCVPKRGIYFVGWTDPLKFSKRQIWTQGQGIDNRHWIPMFDDMSDKITTDIYITFNKRYKVLSNGVLAGEKNLTGDAVEYHYQMQKPHAPYLIMLAIGDYKIKNYTSKSGVKINAYYYPELDYCSDTMFRYSAEMMDFLEKETGLPYPWEQYSMVPVQEYMYGAMENTTATIFGDFFHVDEYSINDRDFLAVSAHELAHQWFGDYVTAYSSAHVWLQESFATHYNWLVEEAYFGKDHYDWIRKSATENILKESEKNLNPIAHSQAGTTRIYPKGAYVLHMIKHVIGKDAYNASIKRYLMEHPYTNVESNDLLVAIYKETGNYLDWFFDQWIYRGGEPHYEVKFERLETTSQSLAVFYVKQTQPFKDNVYLFKMPIDFEVHFSDRTSISKRVMIADKDQVVQIPFDKSKQIAFVLFDPNSHILKKVTFKKNFEMLKQQATNAPNMTDRYDAIVEMNEFPLEQKRALLQERFYKENFHAIQSAIVRQLAKDTADIKSIELLKFVLNQGHPWVQRTLMEHTPKIPSALKQDFFQMLSKTKSYLNIEQLMWLLYDNFPDEYKKIIAFKDKFRALDKRIEISALAIEYLKTQKKEIIEKLTLYASPSFEFRTRINAFNAFVKISYIDEKVRKYLKNASESANYRLASVANEVLKHFEKQKR